MNEVCRASQLVLWEDPYPVCIARDTLIDVFLFHNKVYVARGSVKLEGSCARIYNLYTDPAQRRKGYSSIILQKCIDIARENGYTQIDAIIHKDNKASRKLHRKFKFKRQKHGTDKYRYYLEII